MGPYPPSACYPLFSAQALASSAMVLRGKFQLRHRMRVLRNIQRRLPTANHIGFDAPSSTPGGLIQWAGAAADASICKPLIIRLSEAEVGEAFSLGAGVEGEHEPAVRAQDHLRRQVETGGVCPASARNTATWPGPVPTRAGYVGGACSSQTLGSQYSPMSCLVSTCSGASPAGKT